MSIITSGIHNMSIGVRFPELARFVNEQAIQKGSFTLASGRPSKFYCDGKMISLSCKGASLLVDAILETLSTREYDAIGGMEMGAIPIVGAMALRYSDRGMQIPAFVVRKESKLHGTCKRIEGPIPNKPSRVVIVDDVVTTGGSILDAIKAVQKEGHTVILAISMLDREEGGAESLSEHGVPYEPLVTISELDI